MRSKIGFSLLVLLIAAVGAWSQPFGQVLRPPGQVAQAPPVTPPTQPTEAQPPPPPAPPIGITVNGQLQQLDTAPITVQGRVLVPLRGVIESLGGSMQWIPPTQTILATVGDRQIRMVVGVPVADVNGRRLTLEVAPQVVQGRVYAPLRFVSEALGTNVTWNTATQTVSIATPPPAAPVEQPAPTPEELAAAAAQAAPPPPVVEAPQTIIVPAPPPVLQAPPPPVDDGRTVNVSMFEWGISISPAIIRSGVITFNVTNNGNLNHALAIMNNPAQTAEIAPGESTALTVRLQPGTYTLYGPLNNRRLIGMNAQIAVR